MSIKYINSIFYLNKLAITNFFRLVLFLNTLQIIILKKKESKV